MLIRPLNLSTILVCILLTIPSSLFFSCGDDEDETEEVAGATDTEDNTNTNSNTPDGTQNNNTGNGDDNSGTPLDLAALTATCEADLEINFDNLFSVAIDGTCANGGCHDTGAGGMTLIAGNPSANRDTLLDKVLNDFSDDISLFDAKISGVPSHGGGDQSAVMTPTATSNWWDNEQALRVFESAVQPAIDASCSAGGCHGGGAGGLTLFNGTANAANNRGTLISKIGLTFSGNGEEFFNKVSNVTAHAGGDQSSTFTRSIMETWWSAEATCP